MSVHRTASGKWRVMWREHGRQQQATFSRERDARKADRDIATRVELGDVGIRPAAGPMNMNELWADYAAGPLTLLATNTQNAYKVTWRKHLADRIGDQPVRAMDGPACAQLKVELAKAVNPPTLAKVLALLSTLLRHAVMVRQLSGHPMRGVVRVPQPKRRRVVTPPAPAAIWALADRLDAEGDSEGAMLVLLVGFAGLRPEEALGLDWRDVGKRTLNVERAVTHGEIVDVKTGRARTVELLPALEEALVSYRLDLGGVAKGPVLGRTWTDDMYRNWRRRSYEPAARAVGIKGPPYDLRHAFASLLLADHRNIVYVAGQLGHAPSLCLDTYGHVMGELAGGRKVNAAKAVKRARQQAGRAVGDLLATDTEGATG